MVFKRDNAFVLLLKSTVGFKIHVVTLQQNTELALKTLISNCPLTHRAQYSFVRFQHLLLLKEARTLAPEILLDHRHYLATTRRLKIVVICTD